MDGWVATWGCALQPADQPDDPPLASATLRQTIRVSVGGRRARLALSNEYGEIPLELGAVAVARPIHGRAGARAIQPGTSVPVTFGGSAAVTIPPGARATTDPFDCLIEARTNLTVTMHVRSTVGPLTTHPGSRTTSHALLPEEGLPPTGIPVGGSPSSGRPPAERVAEPDLPGAISVAHWYLLAALEVEPYDRTTGAVVCLGDSLTDGRGSTTDGNDRWPDVLVDRLYASGLADVAVVNQATGGGRVLRDGLGVAALHRLDRDVLAVAGVRWLLLFAGINDIGTAEAIEDDQRRIGDELVAGYARIIERSRARGIQVYAATLTPFGGHEYDDPAGLRERTRRRVNGWLRDHAALDRVVEFDRAVRRPDNYRRLRRALQDGDGLHLNPAGYRALAEAVPTDLFPRR